jgi:hypothetical protein
MTERGFDDAFAVRQVSDKLSRLRRSQVGQEATFAGDWVWTFSRPLRL